MSEKRIKEIQILVSDTYFRLLSQVEAVFRNLNSQGNYVRFKNYDLNHPNTDLQGYLLGLEGFLNAMFIFQKSLNKHNARMNLLYNEQNIKYIEELMGLNSKVLQEAPNQVIEHAVNHVLKLMRAGQFDEILPNDISQKIMDDETKSKLCNSDSNENIKKALQVGKQVYSLNETADKRIKEALETDEFDENSGTLPIPLISRSDLKFKK